MIAATYRRRSCGVRRRGDLDRSDETRTCCGLRVPVSHAVKPLAARNVRFYMFTYSTERRGRTWRMKRAREDPRGYSWLLVVFV